MRYYLSLPAIIIFFTLLACGQRAEEPFYIIPANYKGTVVIIFNQKNGEPSLYKNEKRLYKIPKNGILKTQFETNFGVASGFHFTYENAFKELKYMLPRDWRNHPKDLDEIVCWNLETGVTQDTKNQKINFEVFSIGPIRESEKISDEKSAFVTKALAWAN